MDSAPPLAADLIDSAAADARIAPLSQISPTFDVPPPRLSLDSNSRWTQAILLAAVLIIATALRLPFLGQIGYGPDELWSAELAMGRGSEHLVLPRNQLIPPPPIYDLHHAAAWWRVWTRMECTHPPLYYVLLRLWMNLFGTGDVIERLFSVLTSVAAVAVLFDVVRILANSRQALWASLLMALAEPQIDHARMTRNYALLMLVALATADAGARIVHRGANWKRLVALTVFLLATMLTHYFCIGAMAALFVFGVIRLRAENRTKFIGAFVTAAIVFAIAWGPFLWQQRHLFANTDEGMLFLNELAPSHVAWTLQRFLLVPAVMLVGSKAAAVAGIGMAGALLYVLPLGVLRRRPELMLWTLWLIATPGFVLLLDLSRHTSHLFYVRYTMLAGPAVYALLPGLLPPLQHRRWLGHVIPAAAAVLCALAIPQVFAAPEIIDPHAIQRQFQPLVHAGDAVLFVGTGDMDWAAGENYLLMLRYFDPLPGQVAILDRPADASILQQVRRQPLLLVFTKTEDARLFVPGLAMRDFFNAPGRGIIWTMTPPIPQTPPSPP